MKKISIKLSSGDEIFCGMAYSVLSYLLIHTGEIFVPLHGSRKYTIIKNIYSEKHNDFVTYFAHD